MKSFETERLVLSSFTTKDFELFVETMLTDPKVITYFYSYQGLTNLEEIRKKALKDFWIEFEESVTEHNLDVWAARTKHDNRFIGWSALLHTEELSTRYDDAPELQYMLASHAHGQGYATELASAVLNHAKEHRNLKTVIATVDIPNKASTRVLEKLRFKHLGQIEAYGSTEMYMYLKEL